MYISRYANIGDNKTNPTHGYTTTDNSTSYMTSSMFTVNVTSLIADVTDYNDIDEYIDASLTNDTVEYYDDIFYEDKVRPICGICLAILGLVTLTGPYRRHSYSLYLTSMCVYDFIYVLIGFLDYVLELSSNVILRHELIWDIPCRLYEYLNYSSMIISLWLNVAVAGDRYIIIAFPFKRDRWCNRRNSWFICGGLFVLVHSTGIVYIVFGGVQYYEDDQSYYCNGQDVLHYMDLYLTYLVGVIPAIAFIIIFSTLSVIKLIMIKVKRKEMTSQQLTKDSTSRVTVALVTISLCAFVTQVPIVTNEVLRTYAYYNDVDLFTNLWNGSMPFYDKAVKIFEALVFVNNIQNFFVLYGLNNKFRQDVAMLFKCCGSSKTIKLRATRQTPVTPRTPDTPDP